MQGCEPGRGAADREPGCPGRSPTLCSAWAARQVSAIRAGLGWPPLGVFTLAALAGNRIASRVSESRLTALFTRLLTAAAACPLPRSLPALL